MCACLCCCDQDTAGLHPDLAWLYIVRYVAVPALAGHAGPYWFEQTLGREGQTKGEGHESNLFSLIMP
jgi:hypothetical protein